MSEPSPRAVLYTGSFDPLTYGHLDVIRQASLLFDRVVIGVGANPGKTSLLPLETRQKLVHEALTALQPELSCAFEVIAFNGLAVHAAEACGACAIVRGLRDGADFDYEAQMAGMNATLAPRIRTVFFPASASLRHISASLVRQIAALGGDVSAFVPPQSGLALRRALDDAQSN